MRQDEPLRVVTDSEIAEPEALAEARCDVTLRIRACYWIAT